MGAPPHLKRAQNWRQTPVLLRTSGRPQFSGGGTIQDMTNRLTAPVLGLPARIDEGGDREYLIRDYADAICASGGIPIILPFLEHRSGLQPVLEALDGIVLTGADSDVAPEKYGTARRERCGWCHPLHEETDFFLLEQARVLQLPVLAICFGMQSLNVFLGGTLIQDIPSETGGPIPHSVPESEGKPCHTIRIKAGSILEGLAGVSEAEVNSTHHQAVAVPGRGLEVLARCPDGIVESVALIDREQWILGVQWHPEKSYSYDRFSKNIFDAFVAECRGRR
jgi:putative glutamine amidotransferase